MSHDDQYPPFDAPEQLSGKDPAEWKKAEARLYFDRLVDQVEPRSTRLLQWLGVDDRPDHAGVLREVGAAAVERLRSPAFSGPGTPVPVVLKGHEFDYDRGQVLTEQGLAFGADLGLLVTRYLLADFGDKVRFEIGGVVRHPRIRPQGLTNRTGSLWPISWAAMVASYRPDTAEESGAMKPPPVPGNVMPRSRRDRPSSGDIDTLSDQSVLFCDEASGARVLGRRRLPTPVDRARGQGTA